MGVDKSGLYHRGNTLLEHMEMLLQRTGIKAIYRSYEEHIADKIKGRGPLGGVHSTLKEFQGVHPYLLYLPVDMPALEPFLLQQLINAPTDSDIVHFKGYILPFRLKVMPVWVSLIEDMLKEDNSCSLRAFQQKLRLCVLPVDPGDAACFSNINTQVEWEKYKASSR